MALLPYFLQKPAEAPLLPNLLKFPMPQITRIKLDPIALFGRVFTCGTGAVKVHLSRLFLVLGQQLTDFIIIARL